MAGLLTTILAVVPALRRSFECDRKNLSSSSCFASGHCRASLEADTICCCWWIDWISDLATKLGEPLRRAKSSSNSCVVLTYIYSDSFEKEYFYKKENRIYLGNSGDGSEFFSKDVASRLWFDACLNLTSSARRPGSFGRGRDGTILSATQDAVVRHPQRIAGPAQVAVPAAFIDIRPVHPVTASRPLPRQLLTNQSRFTNKFLNQQETIQGDNLEAGHRLFIVVSRSLQPSMVISFRRKFGRFNHGSARTGTDRF